MQQFYVYAHSRPGGGVFYIGKGKGGRISSTNSRNNYWRNIVRKHGAFVPTVLATFDNELDAFEAEVEIIDLLRAMGVALSNMTQGGEGSTGLKHSPESLEKMLAFHNGKRLSDKHKLAIKRGLSREDVRQKLRIAAQGKKPSAEALAKMSAAQLGRVHKDSTKEKIRAANKGVKKSDKHILKMVATKRNLSRSVCCIENSLVFQGFAGAKDWLTVNGWPKASMTPIWQCCHGRDGRKTAYGFTWKFV